MESDTIYLILNSETAFTLLTLIGPQRFIFIFLAIGQYLSSLMNDYGWTTGNDPNLVHVRKIDSGAYGDVHQVCPSMISRIMGSSNATRTILYHLPPAPSMHNTLILDRSLHGNS